MSSQALNNVNKLRDIVSVRDFGAVGDGVVNDTASIQAAVTYGLANNVAVYWPTGTYICGALTASSGGDLIWFGENSAEIKCTGTDITLISPSGNVRCTGLKFTDYMIGFNFTSIAAAKTIIFDNCTIQNCGTINTGGGRADFQGFITNKNASSNKIKRLEVIDCNFVGDDFGVSWQGKLESAVITGCSFISMRRIAVLIGLEAVGRTAQDCEDIIITNNTFQDIISNDAAEYEIHAVLVYGYRAIVSNNTVNQCYDIHASIHDSEAIYVKALLTTISGNVIQDGARGDGFITVKGSATALEPDDVTDANTAKYVIVSENVIYASDDFVATYGTPFSAVYSASSRVDIKNNNVSGTFDRCIYTEGSGHISGNTMNVSCTYGVLHAVSSSTDKSFIKITDNYLESRGALSAAYSTRLVTSTAFAFPLVQIDNNAVVFASTGTIGGEQGIITIRPDRVSVGNNSYTFVQINNNSLNGRSGITPNGIIISTEQGSGNNGIVSTLHCIGNSGNFLDNAIRLSAGAGDVAYMHVADATFQNVSNFAFSNPNLATVAKIRNIRGNRVLTNSGTATITSANTEVTVTMGITSGMRPTTFDLISVRPTNNLGAATKWWIDTLSGDTFKIKVNTAPGGSDTATFAWEAKNQYYY